MKLGMAVAETTREMDDRLDEDWHRSLTEAVRDVDELITWLQLPEHCREPARRAAELFPLMIPKSYLARIGPGDPNDPLLLQVLPLGVEHDDASGFITDAVADRQFRIAPGLLHKYSGRALMIASGACAIHCRYCFRRHYPYGQEPRRLTIGSRHFTRLKRTSRCAKSSSAAAIH